jgi:phospholipid transport system substrate-binding protein
MGKGFAAWLLVTLATAAPATPPRDVVQNALTRVAAVLEMQMPDGEQVTRGQLVERRRAELRKIAKDVFDFDEMARRALSRHWANRSTADHAEFVTLFTEMLERAYVGRIESLAGERVSILGETIDGNYATVRSRITGKRHDTTLDYRLHLDEGRWQVFDIVIDGVSFVSTYRAEFDRVIRTSSYTGLVERLRQKQLEVEAFSSRIETH